MSRLYSCLLLLSLALFHLSVNAETIQEELVRLTNEYRQANGLPAVPISYTLTKVAILHTLDQYVNRPMNQTCNAHSWSNKGYGMWSGCCYTADHTQSQCMYSKAKEISGGAYTGMVFENAAGPVVNTAAYALELWKGSPPHNDVILSRSGWETIPFKSIGASICNGFAVLWFGDSTDPVGGNVASLTCDTIDLPTGPATPTTVPTTSTPVNIPMQAPPVPAPVQTPVTPPVRAPVQAPVNPPIRAPVQVPSSAPIPPQQTPTQVPVNPPTQTPVTPPVRAPVQAPAPVQVPSGAPVRPPQSRSPNAQATPRSRNPNAAPQAARGPNADSVPESNGSPIAGDSVPVSTSGPNVPSTPQSRGFTNLTPQSTNGPSATSTPSSSPSDTSLLVSGSVSVCASIIVALASVLVLSL